MEGTLYKRGFTIPLIKCLGPIETQEVLADIHDGIYGQHLGAKALAKKALRAGYYWPTMLKDAQDYVNLCDICELVSVLYYDIDLVYSRDPSQ